MTLVMRCNEKDRLAGYLYGECSAAERAAVEAHLSRCAACASELDDLKAVRLQLAGWKAPDTDLGFRVTREPAATDPQPWSSRVPAWAQAAAAVLVLGAGAGLANLQIEYGRQGLSVRTGRQHPDGTPAAFTDSNARAAGTQPIEGPAETPVTSAALKEFEQRLRAEFASGQHPGTVTAPAAATVSPRDLLSQVKVLLDERDERHRNELAMRLAEVVRDVEAQRRSDLVRIEQTMGQIEGVTTEQAKGQREVMNYLMRVSLPQRR